MLTTEACCFTFSIHPFAKPWQERRWKTMETNQLNTATFIGIDAHPTTHTAYAMNRFEDEKGILTFENTPEGINQFLLWIPTVEKKKDTILVGIEGGGNSRHALLAHLLKDYQNIFEVNPLYT